jgi:hypothetical protein
MVMEILPYRDQIELLKEEYKAHPENYPEIPGNKYHIVVCDSEGTPIKARGRGRISPENPIPKIMSLPDGLEKKYLTHPLT